MEHPHSAIIRTAIDLKRAVDNAADYLQPIGFCPTLVDAWRTYNDDGYKGLDSSSDEESGIDNELNVDEEESEADENDEEEGGGGAKVKLYKGLMQELGALKKEHSLPSFIGTLETPFTLTVTRATCEFSGEIVPSNELRSPYTFTEDVYKREAAMKKLDDEARATLLKKWFDGGAVSGYGDVKAQETKIDPAVRDAREIPASEFSVEPELLDQIKTFWGAHFFPTLVRVEPYKIHIYGPGGHFKEHRDTPETDLVGTFLVGLGDSTSNYLGGLAVNVYGWKHYKADPGSWVAFYPDVRHKVTKVQDGYRAVIAFKVFRLPGTIEDPRQSVAQVKITAVLDKMPERYGMMLEHKYSKGTTQLSGFDAYLFAAAKSRMNSETHLIPVLTKLNAMADHYSAYYRQESEVYATVFPLTEPHVKALLELLDSDSGSESPDGDNDGSSERSVRLSLEGTEAAWIEEHNVNDVPFYSVMDLHITGLEWSVNKDGGAEKTGNESRPTTEDSIYLSYAMVVLPTSGGTGRDDEND